MGKPVVAIVGRPNVGKSTLFNRLIGERRAIVEDMPGVTRDRIYGETEWNGRKMILADTGGIVSKAEDAIVHQTRMQAEAAIESADVVIFLCDVRTGIVPDDREIYLLLKKSGKPVITAVNKCDRVGSPPLEFYDFYEFGFDRDPIPVSSVHGSGTGDILDAVVEALPSEEEDPDPSGGIRVAVIGKPNVGKSSIVNRMIGEERLIVTNIAGTTRDAVDTEVANEYGNFIFIDTAGIRRSSKVRDSIERYSVMRAKTAVERADVCLIMIDAAEGVTEQDGKIAGIAHESGKASVIVVNKWDLAEKNGVSVRDFEKKIASELAFMPYAPVIYASAKTGRRIDSIFGKILEVYEQFKKRITTGVLNEVLAEAVYRVQPPSDKGRILKIFYMTQTGAEPPTFVIFCNNSELFHFSYQRYLENELRASFGFEGVPVRLVIRERADD